MKRIKTLSKETRGLYSSLLRSLFLCFVAFFAIVVATAAWFVNNSSVNSGGVSISHQNENIILATKGERQQKEESLLMLPGGFEKIIDGDTYYCTDDGEIALRLAKDETTVSPGSSGEITFYVIPENSGSQSVSLYFSLYGYEEDEEKNSGDRINDIVLSSLLCGHILIFENHGENGYSDRIPGSLSSSGGLSYRISRINENATAGVPWAITLYWVWPLRYENMKDDYNNQLNSYIVDQSTDLSRIDGTEYYYSQIFLTKNEYVGDDVKSKAYNQADEYIGNKANYLYVSIQTELMN